MALRTPPPSRQKKTNRFTYYEDLYGTRNGDEEFDRFPDECEDETDSDDNSASSDSAGAGGGGGFFRPYVRSAQKHHSPKERSPKVKAECGGARGGSRGDVGRERSRGQGTSKNITPDRNINTNITNTPQWKIAPNHSTKRSIPATPSKKLTPKKTFGMFSMFSAPPAMMTASGNEVNNALNNFTSGALGDLDDGFPTLEEGEGLPPNPYVFDNPAGSVEEGMQVDGYGTQVNGYGDRADSEIDPLLISGAAQATSATAAVRGTSTAPTSTQVQEFVPQKASSEPPELNATDKAAASEDDGYQADRDEVREELQEPQPKRRGRPPKSQGVGKGKASAVKEETLGRTRKTTDVIKGEKRATRSSSLPKTRSTRSVAPVYTPVKRGTKNKTKRSTAPIYTPVKRTKTTTARGATLGRKPAKKPAAPLGSSGVSKKRLERGTRRSGRIEASKNWLGEKMEFSKDGQGYVVSVREKDAEWETAQQCY